MKNLSQFKKRIQVGIELETIHVRMGSYGIRKVTKVQTNGMYLESKIKNGRITTDNDYDEIANSWIDFPSAKDFEIVDEDTCRVYWGEGDAREHVLTYKFVKK